VISDVRDLRRVDEGRHARRTFDSIGEPVIGSIDESIVRTIIDSIIR
tara:strand:- start:1462 stop:1602 length:141 start_codon:yes stop_codon:yes gene_type:complete